MCVQCVRGLCASTHRFSFSLPSSHLSATAHTRLSEDRRTMYGPERQIVQDTIQTDAPRVGRADWFCLATKDFVRRAAVRRGLKPLTVLHTTLPTTH